MSLVVDTSIVISVITNEKSKTKLVKLTKNEDLLAPAVIHWEVGNAFSAMLKRKRIDLKSAKKAIDIYQLIPIRLVDVDLKRSLEISDQFGIYAYDSYFLECARGFGIPFINSR
ncbi:MAG: type II toxin-antitoxin system VapC family toxin [Melioribacteraceae bacterium]|nr:type II toxin-antitoxin system VapC family toxin [Melioribacteraceae bacterium]